MDKQVIVAGAGPAGLTAALVLARAGRSVLVVDAGNGRNAPSEHAFNVFTRDGTPPSELRAIGRSQAAAYGAEFIDGEIVFAEATDDAVHLTLADGQSLSSYRLLLATGVEDMLPDIPGLRAGWGHTVVHCPYCHGHELRGLPTAILGRGPIAVEFSRFLKGWTSQITLLTNGPSELTPSQIQELAAFDIELRDEPIERVEVAGKDVRSVRLQSGAVLDIRAIYLRTEQRLRGALPDVLDLARTDQGFLQIDAFHRTSSPAVFACGDAVTIQQIVQVGAASGASAATAVNHDLIMNGRF